MIRGPVSHIRSCDERFSSGADLSYAAGLSFAAQTDHDDSLALVRQKPGVILVLVKDLKIVGLMFTFKLSALEWEMSVLVPNTSATMVRR